MRDLPSLIWTLRTALEALEDEAAADPDPVLKAICHDVRQSLEELRRVEQADDMTVVEIINEMILRRKGITIVHVVSGAEVRELLKAKGFTRLAQDVSNEQLAGVMESTICIAGEGLAEIEGRLVETAARELVELAGLEWPGGQGT